MSNPTFASLSARLSNEVQLLTPLLPTYIHLLLSAIFPIITASFASLSRPSSAAPRKKKSTSESEELDDSESDAVQKVESLSPSDALIFPVLAGCTLTGLYFLIKWLGDAALLNLILGWYFGLMGIGFLYKFFRDGLTVLRGVLFPSTYAFNGHIYRIDAKKQCFTSLTPLSKVYAKHSPLPGFFSALPLPTIIDSVLWKTRQLLHAKYNLAMRLPSFLTKTRKPLKLTISTIDVLAATASVAITAYHTLISKPWPLTNILGFSFCYLALQLTSPTTAWTGTLILSALFFYDIYFVFFTSAMVTVATKLDVPIKLLFPRPDSCIYPIGVSDTSEAMKTYLLCKGKKRAMAMLGLGDIVIPGLMIGLALRFDLYMFYLRKQEKRIDENEGRDLVRKHEFMPVVGAWGERLWTSRSVLRKTLTTTTKPAVGPKLDGTPQNSDVHARILAVYDALTSRSFPKPYFYATLAGYVLGLITTVLVMQFAQHAQPALLYLCPGVLGGIWGCAWLRGEFGLLWEYAEEDEAEKEREKEKREKEAAKGDGKVVEHQGNGTEGTEKKKAGEMQKGDVEVEDSADEGFEVVESEAKKDR